MDFGKSWQNIKKVIFFAKQGRGVLSGIRSKSSTGILNDRLVNLKGSGGTMDDVGVGMGDESWKMDRGHIWMAGAHSGAMPFPLSFEMSSFLRIHTHSIFINVKFMLSNIIQFS